VDINGDPLTASDDAQATVLYHHASNAVQVRKTPTGDTLSPGNPFKYTMTFTNIGDVDINNPVITDVFPSDAQGPQIQLAPDPAYSFALAGGSGIPTDPADVTIDPTDTGIVFTFPEGSTLPIGATYTITYMAVTRAGLAADTQFTNTVGINADRPWDSCDGGPGGGLDADTGQCQAVATNTVTSAGAISVTKLVKAQGSDVLGVALDPLVTVKPACLADADGFYARPCIPIAQPGGDIAWRWHFVNTGNLPLDRILGIDRLPEPGDAVATAPDLARFSQWQPLLSGDRPTLSGAGPGTYNVFYTTGTAWCDGPQGQDGQLLCPALDWQRWPVGQALPVDPATVTGLQIEFLPDTPIAPAASFDVDLDMKAPAFSPADTPNTTAMSATDTYAFNTVGTAARVAISSGSPGASGAAAATQRTHSRPSPLAWVSDLLTAGSRC
jgi:large repetitive protein